jgi:tetratricopeptide (TPR) repeat protein/flagellar motor protein MotB
MPKVFLTLILLLGEISAVFAQEKEDVPPIYMIPDEYSKIHQAGETALLMKKFSEAIRHFKKVLKKYPDFPPALRSAGACYELMGEYKEAAGYYEAALLKSPRFSRAMYYEVGNIFYKCGDYRKALHYFETFDSLKQVDFKAFTYNGIEERQVETGYYEKLSSSIRSCRVALDSIQFLNIASVQNLGSNINTKGDEYFPFLSNDENTIFYTSRKNEEADENLFLSSRPKGEWRIGEAQSRFNTDENEGMISLVRDGRRLFFTACQRPAVLGQCDIWEAAFDGHNIENPQPVTGYANSGKWDSQASVSCDGNTLYFASNRDGGLGGTDIWVSQRQPDGRWAEPVNPGENINTSGDEEAPFITNDGKVLYFSSTGHLGLGEQDLFMSRLDDKGGWSSAVNLGMPVNSAARELGFFLSADGKTGYFASNRSGGQGGMDIYKFTIPEALFTDPITYFEGYVRDSITRLPVPCTVHIKNRSFVKTDADGRFFLCLDAGDSLYFEIKEPDYHLHRNFLIVPNWNNRTAYKKDFLLDPLFRLPVYSGELATATTPPNPTAFHTELKHIVLFEFDKAELKADMMKKLDAFLASVLSGKPVQNVEIIGYADDIGKDAYNLVLSEKRAKAVGVYLKEKGIRVDRIYIEGKGETYNNKEKWENRKVEVVVRLNQ